MEDAAKAPASKALSQLPKERLLPQDQLKQYEPGPSPPFSIRTKFEGTIRMRVRKSLWLFVALVVLVVSLDGVLHSQSPTAPISDEYLLLGSPNRGAGEPWVFVNPKDSNNIIVVAMATLNRLPSGEAPLARTFEPGQPSRLDPARTALRVKELSTPDGSRTDIAVTHDGGKTWTFSVDDLRKTLDKNRCSDSFAGAGPDGMLYMGCLAYLNRGASDYAEGFAPNGEAHFYHGGSAIESSGDDGRSWTHPVWVHPALSPQLYASTVKPVLEQASPWDRPVFVADALTGTIFVSGSGLAWTVDPATVQRPKPDPSLPSRGYDGYPSSKVSRSRTFIRASHDDGATWGVIYPFDNDDYPGGAFAGVGGFSAANGHLVVAYTASRVPAAEHATCPCTLIGISQDDGKTFDYKVVPPLAPSASNQSGPGRGFGRVMVSADPTKDGRYAVARQDANQIVISLTEDGGKTWLPPIVAAEIPPNATFGHRAMKYSPKGDLGLIWKAMYPDRSFDVWSAVSREGTRTFKTVRVSHAVSPPCSPDRCNFMFGDDLSSMDIDSDYLYVVWGDNRSGFLGTWFGRIPLSAY